MADIWRSPAVPAANDNLSSVSALLRLADELEREPPRRLRVILLSTGSEESFLEAMVRFGERHFADLPRASTTFLCLESIGSPQLMLLSGEGLLRLHRYPRDLIARLTRLAAENGIPLREPFTYRLATDGQVPLRAGYPTAVISSMDWYKAPSNYHWPTDRPENLDPASLDGAVRLALGFLRELDRATETRAR
jgi:Zn-dependent M28 family amino/carboxypeptidase